MLPPAALSAYSETDIAESTMKETATGQEEVAKNMGR